MPNTGENEPVASNIATLVDTLRRAEAEIRSGKLATAKDTLLDWTANLDPLAVPERILHVADLWAAVATEKITFRDGRGAIKAIARAVELLLTPVDQSAQLITVTPLELQDLLNIELNRRALTKTRFVVVGDVQQNDEEASKPNWSLAPEVGGGRHAPPDEVAIATKAATEVIAWAQSVFQLPSPADTAVRTSRYRQSRKILTISTELRPTPSQVEIEGMLPRLAAGTRVRVLESRAGWSRIVTDQRNVAGAKRGSLTGWVPETLLAPTGIKATLRNMSRGVSWPEPLPLAVVADLNAVPADLVTELLSALDELHRAHGGGGLRILRAQTGSEVLEVTAV